MVKNMGKQGHEVKGIRGDSAFPDHLRDRIPLFRPCFGNNAMAWVKILLTPGDTSLDTAQSLSVMAYMIRLTPNLRKTSPLFCHPR
jgi:hypothetical protein